MGYINSVAYVQQEIFCKRYVRGPGPTLMTLCAEPDLSLTYLKNCASSLTFFFEYNISIKPIKFFLNYPYVGLLGQQVNSLGLTTLKEKLWTIKHLTYSETLGALKYYLGLTSYLRNYIYFYTKLAAPL